MCRKEQNELEAGDVEKEQYLKTAAEDPLGTAYVSRHSPINLFLERIRNKDARLKELEKIIPGYMIEKWQQEIEQEERKELEARIERRQMLLEDSLINGGPADI